MLLLQLYFLSCASSTQNKQQLTVRFAPYRCDGSQQGVCSGCLQEEDSAVYGKRKEEYVYGGSSARSLLLSPATFTATRGSDWNFLWTQQAQRCFDVGAKVPLLAGICAKVAAASPSMRRLCNHCNYFTAAISAWD